MTGLMLNPIVLQAGGSAPANAAGMGAAQASSGVSAASILGTAPINALFASLLSENTAAMSPLPQTQDGSQQLTGGLLNIQLPTTPLPDSTLAAQQALDAASANTVDIYTLTTSLAPEKTPEPDHAPAPQAPVNGLFGSRDNVSDQSLQNLMARVATSSITAEQQAAQDFTKAATTQEKTLTLLQAGTTLPTLPANANTDSKDNALAAIAKKASTMEIMPEQKVVVQTDTTNSSSDHTGHDKDKGSSLSGLLAANTAYSGNDANQAPQGIAPVAAHIPASASHPTFSTPGAGQDTSYGQPVTLDQVHVKIAQAVQSGDSKIDLQLEPASLGKIQVHIDMSGGKASITIHAEKSETLDMLKNDSGSLQKSLADAGIKADAGSMQFAQKDSSGFAFTNQFGGRGYEYTQNTTGRVANDEMPAANPAYRVYESNRALDIFA